jgi:GT2 family glycosyltransferase
MIRASLIVLNYEGREVVRPCLDSLVAAMGGDDELIVVDNNSQDGSADLCAEYDRVRLIRLPENTYIFGLNAGLEVARGQYVAFLNNDMIVEPGFVDQCLELFDDATFAVCPRIMQSGVDQGSRTRGFLKHGLLFYESLPHTSDPSLCFFAVGGQSFFDRAKLTEIGSIDPLLHPMYHEDIELSYRAWKRGWLIRYAPNAVVDHIGGYSSKRVFTPLELRSFVRQNEFLTAWKDFRDPGLVARHISLLLPRLGKAAISADWGTVRGFGRAAARLGQVRRQRRVARQHFVLSDRQVLDLVSTIT